MTTKKNKDQLKIIDSYRDEGKSLMIFLCDPYHLPELHRILIEIYQPTPKDIYKPPGSKLFTLHYKALEILGNKAGISWDSDHTGPTEIKTKIIHYRATGFYTREFSNRVSRQGEGLSDLDVIKDDLRAKYEADARKDDKKDASWVDYCTDRDFRAKRKKRLQLAAAEAHAQVYRKLLGMGDTFPEAAFKRPIIIVRCVVAADYTDPETVKMIQSGAAAAATNIYGEHPFRPGITDERGNTYAPDDVDTKTIIPEEQEEDPTPEEARRMDFENAPDETQVQTLNSLIERKGYTMPISPRTQTPIAVETLSPERRLELYDKLIDTDDAEEDDIPF